MFCSRETAAPILWVLFNVSSVSVGALAYQSHVVSVGDQGDTEG